MSRAYAYFRIVGEELPINEITELLGVNPTESWNKGEPGEYNSCRPDSAWCLHSPLPQSNANLERHIESLLSLLEPRTAQIKELGERYETYLVCVGYYDSLSSPGLFLPRGLVASIASMGLAIDADLYFEDSSSGSPLGMTKSSRKHDI